MVMLPCLTAAIEGRSCWPSSSQGALLDGCWSSPSPLSYRELCAAVGGEQRGDVTFSLLTFHIIKRESVSLPLFEVSSFLL